MITIENLSKTYWDRKRGSIEAVLPTNLEINRGEIFGLLGPNGAGKTTLLRMLATVLTPTSGFAVINGFHLLNQLDAVKKSVGFISGNTKLYGRLTPRELLKYFGELYEIPIPKIKSRSEEIFKMLDMYPFVDQRIEKLSTGQTQKTSIARCMLHDPPIYILDEPTLGLDVLTSRTIIDFIQRAAVNGKTILLSTHYMEEAELLCHRIGMLHLGKILAIDTLAGFKTKYQRSHLADIFLACIAQSNPEARHES
jgi:sodium transport system ATP-binding protein